MVRADVLSQRRFRCNNGDDVRFGIAQIFIFLMLFVPTSFVPATGNIIQLKLIAAAEGINRIIFESVPIHSFILVEVIGMMWSRQDARLKIEWYWYPWYCTWYVFSHENRYSTVSLSVLTVRVLYSTFYLLASFSTDELYLTVLVRGPEKKAVRTYSYCTATGSRPQPLPVIRR